jgi:hypothetical protein
MTIEHAPSISNMSLKARRRAAQQWAAWRNAGEPATITCKRAYELTGIDWYGQRDPRVPVRLTAVAINYIKKGERL